MKYTIRREKFVAEYLVSGNGAQSAIKAGYSAKGARVQASRLLTKANVSVAIEQKRTEAARITGLRVSDVVRGLLEIVEQAKLCADAGAQIQAWAAIAKIMGFYPQKKKKGKSEIDPANIQTWPSEMLEKLR